MSLLAEEEAKKKNTKKESPGWGKCGAYLGITATIFGWCAGVGRRGHRENEQVGSGQVEP